MPVYKYKTSAGKVKWYTNFYYEDWKGNRTHKCKRGFSTKKEAQIWEQNFLNSSSDQPTIKFESLVINYLDEMEPRLKPTTFENKKYLIATKLTPFFGNLEISKITPLVVRRWQNELLNSKNKFGKNYSPTYLKTINNQLSAIMNYAVKFYGLRQNPCAVTGSIGKKDAEEMKFWTIDQFEIFLEHIKKESMRLAFEVLFYTGIREGELLALTVEDVRSDKLLRINKNYAVVKSTEMIMKPKTEKSEREVTLPNFLYENLRDYIENHELEKSDRIFQITKYSLRRAINSGALAAELEPIRVHDLRHSHVSMLIDMGIDIMEISNRLGHESTNTTWKTYAHMYPGKARKIAEKLDEKKQKTADF